MNAGLRPTHHSWLITFPHHSSLYRVSGDFMIILQDLIPEIIPSQKYQWTQVRFSTVRSYGFKMIWSLRRTSGSFMGLAASKIRCSSSPLFTLRSNTRFFMQPHTFKLRGARSGDRSGQFCGPPRPIHRSGNCSLRYYVTCRLKCGVPCHAGSTSVTVFCAVQIICYFYP
jgi:hypothetical protein